jgi:hypothetical protein
MMVGNRATPQAKLTVEQETLGQPVQRLESTATNDNVIEDTLHGRIATTDATVTTLYTHTLVASTVYQIEAKVLAHRTGGTAGTAEDCACYKIAGLFKVVAGAAVQVGTTEVLYEKEDQAAWNATFDVTGLTVRIRVTGAPNNNITWHAPSVQVSPLST